MEIKTFLAMMLLTVLGGNADHPVIPTSYNYDHAHTGIQMQITKKGKLNLIRPPPL